MEKFCFLSQVLPDGWISFAGSIIGAIVTVISIIIALYIGKKQIKQQEKENVKIYYDQLFASLSSIDKILSGKES